MAKSTLAQDFLAICLVVAKGDIKMDLETIILAVERFQEKNHCNFGLEKSNFRMAFLMLLLHEYGVDKFDESKSLKQTKLREIIPAVLEYDDWYSNDEGEHWCCYDKEFFNSDKQPDPRFRGGYNKEEYALKVKQKLRIQAFFNKHENPQTKLVMQFMQGESLNPGLLYRCSNLKGYGS